MRIEAALDRDAHRSLTMHRVMNWQKQPTVMFQQNSNLEVETISSGIALLEKDGKENWSIGVCRPDPER